MQGCRWTHHGGELDQLVDRPFSIREVPGSKPGFSSTLFYSAVSGPSNERRIQEMVSEDVRAEWVAILAAAGSG